MRNGDSTGVEEVPITIDDTVETQATKKQRTDFSSISTVSATLCVEAMVLTIVTA